MPMYRAPPSMRMTLPNNGLFIPPQPKTPQPAEPVQNSPLNEPIIARIHNARSGCGSCGRK